MIAQQHKILRQVIEARGCPPGDASRIRSDLRDVYYRRLLPAIERICSGLSSSDRIHRIDALEIDLGEVPLEELESALAVKFEDAFSRALAAAIGDAPQVDAELELFGYFVRTGTLPWWADPSDRGRLAANIESLIRRAPQMLRREVLAVRDQEQARRRIARAFPDRLLARLAGAMAPTLALAFPDLGTAWIGVLESAAAAQGHTARAARNFWWEELLRAAGAADDVPASAAPDFFRALLARVARRLGLSYRALVADLELAIEGSGTAAPQWVRDIIKTLGRDAGTERDPGSLSAENSAHSEFVRLLAEFERVSAPGPVFQARLDSAIHRLPAGSRAQALAALSSARNRSGAGEIPSRATIGAPADLRFSDTEAIYVGNAGLVILWPFLENFFARLGLIEEKKFKDEAAAHRAAGLLQYVAAADESPPETLLVLNKVLCGLAPEVVFDFGPDITAKEIEECNDLLTAVIGQAPILRDMSIDGFRGSFLLRKGQLGARDGNWLLRVERETHDVVLDHFPWSVHFVKLPWMEAMMQVEW